MMRKITDKKLVMVKPSITWSREYIDAELAREYLLHMAPNRRIKEVRVKQQERALLRFGGYHETHQGVAFDGQGRLIDGGHRLKAIARTGIGSWLWVARGVPEESKAYIDIGVARSPGDMWTIVHGDKRGPKLVPIIRIMDTFLRRTNGVLSDAEVSEYYEKNKEAVDWAVEVHRPSNKNTIAPVLGGLVLVAKISLPAIRGFGEQLMSGIGLEPGSQALLLREYLNGDSHRLIRQKNTRVNLVDRVVMCAYRHVRGIRSRSVNGVSQSVLAELRQLHGFSAEGVGEEAEEADVKPVI